MNGMGHISMRLLIIEDESALAEALRKSLMRLGFAVDLAFDGREGLDKAFINQYDIIILDLNLPVLDGMEVCRKLRTEGREAAILILTARGRVCDKAEGLDNGADDYLVKPFSFEELRARLHALIRRSQGKRNPVMRIGKLTIDPSRRQACYNTANIRLTAREFDILEYLAYRHPNVISAEEIMEHVWNEELDSFSNTVKVHIANLKRKLQETAGRKLIETMIGKGYGLIEYEK
jgi:two-component system response regulator QseB